ncbi:MAG: CRTAC1 family protein [Bacteroidetes bacterium]|nr:CRTAC1 family protein [Bacteroidota bacterium]
MARTLPFALLLVVVLLPNITSAQSTLDSSVLMSGEMRKFEGTRKMVALLKENAIKYNDGHNALANTARVKFFEDLVQHAPENKRLLYQEMLFAGMTERAIEGIKNMLANPRLNPGEKPKLMDLLGIAYLRLGEQENCVANHTAQSCLMPIEAGGYHTIQRGSRSAIDVYKAILAEHPDDIKSRWLLNIAYMTLGEYPEKVPPQYVIPEKVFKSDYPLPRFHDIAPDVGLDVMNLAGGCCMEDFDNDGDLDLLVSSWGVNDQIQYFRNNGDGTFTEQTKEAGLEGITGGINMFHADYNNDGFADVFVARGAWMGTYGNQPSSLLKNNGDGTFTDVTIESGLLGFRPTEAVAWGDFDNDGWLDIFIGCETTGLQGHPCELYRNNHDGTFTNVAHEAGVDFQSIVKSVHWGDYNNDGLIDLYVSNLAGPNKLFRNNGNRNGAWTFTDVAAQAGVQEPEFSFPAFFFDYDNDGWLDIFVSDFGGRPSGVFNGLPVLMSVVGPVANDYLGNPHMVTVPKLYHNNHDGTFTDVAKEMHLDRTMFGMGCNFGDIDNDGFPDIYVGTGHPDLDALIPNRMFRNAEGKVFQDVTTAGGFGHLQKGHAIAFGDIDNDGDQDIFAVMGGAFEGDVARRCLFQNPGNSNHWITILLEGTKANRCAIGARIKVTVQQAAGKDRDIYVMAGTGGTFGSSSLQQEIGLGDARQIRSISIDWPGSHTRQTLKNVQMDRAIKVVEGNDRVIALNRKPIPMPAAGAPATHHHMHNMPMKGMEGMDMDDPHDMHGH